MTEEEASLIYDYLHENYEYRDGEIIAITSNRRRLAGKAIGIPTKNAHRASTKSYIKCTLSVNKRNRSFSLQQLVYLFHKKEFHKYFLHIDENAMNNKIENLIPCSLCDLHPGQGRYMKGVSFQHGKFVSHITKNRKSIYLGRYLTELEAHAAYLKAKEEYLMPEIQSAPCVGNIPVEKIQRAVDLLNENT